MTAETDFAFEVPAEQAGDPPAEPLTEIPLFRTTVRPEWIDYNGHMSEAFYVLAFGHATDAMMIETGMGPGYREKSGCSLYTAEAHVRYLAEVSEGAQLAIRTRILGADHNKVRFSHELYAGQDGNAPETGPGARPAATTELLGIHVHQGTGRPSPLPDTVRSVLDDLHESPPSWAGRSIGAVPKA